MYRVRSGALALAIAAAAVGVLTLVPTGSDASDNCLPGELKSRLAQIKAKFGSVQVISTYRGGARMPNGGSSFHASCRAVDFNPPSGKYSQVANWLKENHGGGVGTYSCGMHHIHIDNGPRIRFHHCQSASGGEDRDLGTVRTAGGTWPVLLKR